MEDLTKGLQKIVLAGIGAAATTAEKADELLKEMIKKGESTVEQGKALNEELKHTLRQTTSEKSNDLSGKVQDMTDEELDRLAAQIEAVRKNRQDKQNEDATEA